MSFDIYNLFNIDLKNVNKDHYSKLELATLGNDLSRVNEYINNGETIFKSNNKNRIVGWRYYKKYSKIPKKTILESYFSAVTISFINNYRIYKSIYKCLVDLVDVDPYMRNKENKSDETCYAIHNILESFIDMEDPSKNQYDLLPTISHNHLNFDKVHETFAKNLSSIRYFFEDLLIGDIRETNIELEKYNGSIHEFSKRLIKIFNKKTLDEDRDKKTKNIGKLFLKLEHMYFENVKIVITILNEQYLEQFLLYLKTYPSDDSLVNWIRNNLRSKYIDPNFGKVSYIHLASSASDYPKTIDNLLRVSAEVQTDCPIRSLMKKHYQTAHILIRKSNKNILTRMVDGKFIFDILYQDEFISDRDRQKFLKELLIKGINPCLTNSDIDTISQLMLCDESDKLLDIILKKAKNKVGIISHRAINLCLEHCKRETLELLYNENCKIEKKEMIQFSYFDSTETDSEKNLNLLEIILRNCKNVNMINNTKSTIIFEAIKKNRIRSLKLILDMGGDPFIRNVNNMNALIFAIKNNNHEATKLLMNYKEPKKSLIMQTYQMKNPFIVALYTNNPIKFINTLIGARKARLSLKQFDKRGFNVYSHLIKIKNITNQDKRIILKKLLPELDVSNVDKKLNQPILIQAVEFDNYEFVLDVCKFLIMNNKIKIENLEDVSGFEDLINSNKKINVVSSNLTTINYYPTVFMYLRQNKRNLKNDKETNLIILFISILLIESLNLIKESMIYTNHKIFS
ncbi:MAG: hypothetical protein CMF62_01045 [Magnetococcales bacterium]|nr:hypothetical protein [Magnetococcales bacterium]|tara:strand:+ start:41922 stop:44147 length:2226 start_codon:yes stop_codon:yes gene_type:complete